MKTALDDLNRILHSSQISNAAKTSVRGFTQPRKITLQDVLLFYIFRHSETTNKDIISYFSKTGKPKVSKQAMFKALDKTNPDVFPFMIRQFAKDFYGHQDYQTLDGWIVLACDGTKMDLPPSEEMREKFGGYLNQTITDKSMVRKPQASCSVLIDVVNHVVLDALVKPCRASELPMLYEHLENCRELLKGKKVMLLCDRYYGSAELFLYCRLCGYKLLVRAKSYMYKNQVAEIEKDGMIQLIFNNAWLRRLKREDCRAYAQEQVHLDLRVIKNHFEYTLKGYRKKQDKISIDSIYMTDLEYTEFSSSDIVELYHVRRWDNETAYFDIKNHLEAERFNSSKYNIVVCELYGKILCYSICGIIYGEADRLLIEKMSETETGMSCTLYDYIPNMKYICDTVRMEHIFVQFLIGKLREPENFSRYLDQLEDDCSRNTVPVRPGRHYKRWGRWMSSIPTAKFRIDGRRNPPIEKCHKANGYMTSQG